MKGIMWWGASQSELLFNLWYEIIPVKRKLGGNSSSCSWEIVCYGSKGYMVISYAKDVNLFKGSAYINVASGFSCEISPCLSHV